MKKIAASDSRQSVGLKWKLRKGLEENVAFKEDGTMDVRKNAAVDGTLTLNTPQNLIFKTGSISPTPEGYSVDDAGNVTIAGALTANNNGDVQVRKNLMVNGKAKLGYVGKSTFNQEGNPHDFFVHEAIFTNGEQHAPRFVAFLPFIENVTLEGASCPVIKDVYGFLIYNGDGTPATTIDEALNGVPGDVPFPLALQGNWNSAEFGRLHVVDLFVPSHKIYLSDSTSDFIDLGLIPTASQAKYQHTVTLSGDGFELCFTAMSPSNVTIGSYQELVSVFRNERIGLTGYSPALSARPVYIDLRGGTADTDFIRVFEENGSAFANHTLSSLGTIRYEDVCIPK